jgi:hypothetical protein
MSKHFSGSSTAFRILANLKGDPLSQIIKIVLSAIGIEMEFIVYALPVKLIGMNSAMMYNYIRFCTN